MYLCPDCDFEQFGINRRIPLGDNNWRYCTPDEFADMIIANMTKADASRFIDTYRGDFYAWTNTRITKEQMRQVRRLEERMANLDKGTIVEWVVDINGNLSRQEKTSPDRTYNPSAFNPLDDLQLMQMSKEDANTYINMLAKDLKDKSLTSYGERSDSSMTFEFLRKPKTQEDAKKEEFKNLQDILFKLEAVAGFVNDEVHECVTSLFLEGIQDDKRIKEAQKMLKSFMVFLVDENYIELDNMVELIGDSSIAKAILIGNY